ncbi:MAG: hypothetical protein HN354_11125 [Deltaproteobacteria bacterium]|nr:hypothetical protein [Deltaproteobacteria bacterium]
MTWILFQIICMVVLTGAMSPANAATPLNSSNWEGTDGNRFWQIWSSGDYYLDTVGDVFSTNAVTAIRIRASNVTLDGRGKTITGSGPPPTPQPSSDHIGVQVNAGPQVSNVQIKNLNVEKKFYGILLEWITQGGVQNCNTSGNHYGITLWAADFLTLTGNTANNNIASGIVLDGNDSSTIDCVNHDNTLTSNTTNNNGETGITLWLESPNNTLTNNIANNNGDKGISLLGDATLPHLKSPENNTLSGNTANNNPVGMYLGYNANSNVIKENTINDSRDNGIWLWSANNNTIYNNYFNNAIMNARLTGNNTGNQWNISQTSGTNIAGGPFLGGNFWGTPSGTGFSQITADDNGDGICNSAYTVASGNVDALPLHAYSAGPTLYVNQSDGACGGNSPCYTSIQGAINAAPTGANIWIAQGLYNENYTLNRAVALTLVGCWNSSFSVQTPYTTIIKPPQISSGSMSFLNLIIRP